MAGYTAPFPLGKKKNGLQHRILNLHFLKRLFPASRASAVARAESKAQHAWKPTVPAATAARLDKR